MNKKGEDESVARMECVETSIRVIRDRRIAARANGKAFKMVLRSEMMNGMETVAVTRMDKFKNKYLGGTAQIETKLERQSCHMQRKDSGYIGQIMLKMELPGRGKRGRPQRTFMDVVKEGMQKVSRRSIT